MTVRKENILSLCKTRKNETTNEKEEIINKVINTVLTDRFYNQLTEKLRTISNPRTNKPYQYKDYEDATIKLTADYFIPSFNAMWSSETMEYWEAGKRMMTTITLITEKQNLTKNTIRNLAYVPCQIVKLSKINLKQTIPPINMTAKHYKGEKTSEIAIKQLNASYIEELTYVLNDIAHSIAIQLLKTV